MKGLVHNLPGEEVAWDTVSGVSAGSINSFYAATYEKGDEKAMVEGSLKILYSLTTDKIFKLWPGGLEDGLLNEKGLVDDSPLLELIEGIHKERPLKRKMNVGATDANLGTFIPFDETTDDADIPRAVVGSSSIPLVFPHIQLKEHTLMDGGSIYGINVQTAINRCREEVDDDKQIVIDIILCFNFGHESKFVDQGNAIYNYIRSWLISTYSEFIEDINYTMEANPNVHFRYLIQPTGDLTFDLLNFNASTMKPMVEMGTQDAIAAIKEGEGAAFDRIRAFAALNPGKRLTWAEFEEFREIVDQE